MYLDTVARRILVRAWEAQLDRLVPRPSDGARVPVRDAFLEQAWAVARVIEGAQDVYTGVVVEA